MFRMVGSFSDWGTRTGPAGRHRPMTIGVTRMATASAILSTLRSDGDIHDYRKLHWEGSFEDYLNIVTEHPQVTRTAYQRLYDMILSHGTEDMYENKEKVTV